ncbi:unnamed protein product [Amoebophrya sp. A120]|nr:unnamed protein product [Amoebophrya sp. A120]|eukprot:GSA120T00002562001.1
MSQTGKRQLIQVHQSTVNRIAKDGLRPREWIFNTRTRLRTGIFQEYVLDYKILDVCLVFKQTLEPGRVAEAVAILCAWYPMLAGRVEFSHDVAVAGAKKWVTHNDKGCSLVLATMEGMGYADLHDHDRTIDHLNFCDIETDMPNKILSGVAPVMTVQLTKLQRGGCVLGIALSHCVCDHGGLQQLLQDWSKLYQDPLALIMPTANVPDCYFNAPSGGEIQAHMRTLGLMRLERNLSNQLIKDAKVGLSLIGQRLASHCRERPDHVRLSFTKFQKDLLINTAANDEEIDHSVTTNEAVLVYIWNLMLDTIEFPMEQREHLAVMMYVDPRSRVSEADVGSRTFGSIIAGISVPVNMRGSLGTVTSSVHFSSRKALRTEKIAASVKMEATIFPENESGEVLFNPQTTTENSGCIGEWFYGAPLLDWQRGTKMATFGADLVRCEVGYSGEGVKVSPRVDGGLDVYLTRMDRLYFNGWPETLAKYPYKGAFVDELKKRHDSWCRKIKPPRRSAFNFAMGLMDAQQ